MHSLPPFIIILLYRLQYGKGCVLLETDLVHWFTALYEQNAPNMVRYAAYQLRNPALAEELVSEAFVRLLQHQQELQEHPNPAGWLWKTLQHLILTEVKLAKYQREVPLDSIPHISTSDPPVESLADALPEGLSGKEREILLLFFEEELTHQEIAARLGISEINSRTRLFRAKNHCKKLLEKSKPSVTNEPVQAISHIERRDGHGHAKPKAGAGHGRAGGTAL